MKHFSLKMIAMVMAMTTFVQANALDYSTASACLSNNYVQEWGKLKLVGNQLCSESGKPIQLRGWSTHGSWYKSCYDDNQDFELMKSYGANVARIAMYVNQGDGVNEEWVKSCIDYTAQCGMYCIVDWHITDGLATSYPNYHPETFFSKITSYVEQKGYKHVLYEICSEPGIDKAGYHDSVVWSDIKKYTDIVLPVIAQNDPDAVVIVPTSHGCKNLAYPMAYPLDNTYGLNVMYAFHYNAVDDYRYIGFLQLAAAYLPVFVTEWSGSDSERKKDISIPLSDSLLKVCSGNNLDNQYISWCSWNFSDKGDNSSAFTGGGYNSRSMSSAGTYVVNQLRKGDVLNTKKNSTPYQKATVVSAQSETVIRVENYDEGGEGVAYHDVYGNVEESVHKCMTGDNTTREGCVDLYYTDEANTSSSIGNIHAGEWVNFTLDVEKAGYYRVKVMKKYFEGLDGYSNRISLMVDGKNAIRDHDNTGKTWNVVSIQEQQGNWAKSPLMTQTDNNSHDFCVYFEKSGKQILTIGFLGWYENSVGNIILTPVGKDAVANASLQDMVKIFPNPGTGGTFSVQAPAACHVQVYDLSGKTCYTAETNSEDVIHTGLGAGMYLVKITCREQSVMKKWVVR